MIVSVENKKTGKETDYKHVRMYKDCTKEWGNFELDINGNIETFDSKIFFVRAIMPEQ